MWSNAIEVSQRGGEIWVAEGYEGLWSFVEVRDHGAGMTHETLQRACDPFFTTRPGQRQGLGLSVASGIARRHGGDLSIKSEPGKGACVLISLLSAAPE